MISRLICGLVLLLWNCSSFALDELYETPENLELLIKEYLHSTVPAAGQGQMTIEIDAIDPRLRLKKCAKDQFKIFNPYRHRRKTSTTVAVSCSESQNRWTIYVPVKIYMFQQVYVAARSLAKGEVVQEQDLRLEERNVNKVQPGYITQPELITHQICTRPVLEGQVFYASFVQKPLLIHKNEQVTIQAVNGTITVSMEGIAQTEGIMSEMIKVKNLSSQKIVEAKIIGEKKVKIEL